MTAAFTAALTIFLARKLGPEDFGVFSLALGIGSVLVLPGDAGISAATARFIAERRGNPAAIAGVLRHASRLRLLTSGAVCAGLVVLAGPLANAYDQPALEWTLRGMAVAIFGQNLMQLYGGAFTALGRIALSFRMTTAKAVVELGASVGLVLAGAGAVGAAFGRGAGFLAGGVFGFFALRRLVGRGGPEEASSPVALRHIAAYAGALFVIEGAFVLFEQIDVLLIGAIIGASAVGLFQAALRMVTFLQYPAQALAAGVAPRVARHEVSGSDVEPLARSLRLLILFQMALIPPIVVWADPLVDLVLGSDYAESAEVLRALAPFVLLAGVGPLLSMAVNYLGEARQRLPIAVGAVALNAAIDAVLIPKIGIVAGAIGTDVAYAVYVPAHVWLVKRMLDIPLRPLAVSFVRALLAGAAMAGVLALFGTTEVALPLLLVGGALATLVYAAVLLVVREVTRAELAELWGSARAGLLPSRP